MAMQTPSPHPQSFRATVPVQLNNSVEHHLRQAQDAVNEAQKSPITLDELQSIKAIAEEQIRRSDEALARLSQRAEKLKESRATLLQKADMNILELRTPPGKQRLSPEVLQTSVHRSVPPKTPFRSTPGPSKATSYLGTTPATDKDRSPRNSIPGSAVPASSQDTELSELGALGERLSQTFAKIESLGLETSHSQAARPTNGSPEASLTDEIIAIQKQKQMLQQRYHNVVESRLKGSSSVPNSARGSFQRTDLTPILAAAGVQQTPQGRQFAHDGAPFGSSPHPLAAMPGRPAAPGTAPRPPARNSNLPSYTPISSASAATLAQGNMTTERPFSGYMPGGVSPSPLQQPSLQVQEQFRQATAMLKESFTEAKVDRNTLAVVRKSKTLAGGDSVTLVGLHIPLELGLRVKLVDPSVDGNAGAGIVSKIHPDGNACFVKWEAQEEECGWYKCGVRGFYALKLLPREEEGPMLPDNVVHTGGNSKIDVEHRRARYDEENMFAADKVLMDIGDFLGSW